MRLSSFLLMALLFGAGPAAAREADPHIVGGTVDDGHPAVVMIFYNLGNGAGIGCSGTMISTTVVLTAGHCTVTDEGCTEPDCTTLTAANYTVYGGTTPFTNPTWTSFVTEVHTNPVYDGANIINGSDSGILKLATPAPVTPVPWMATAASESYQQANAITVVGYGITIQGGTDFGTKRYVNVEITSAVSQNDFIIGDGGQGICNGDSGGPALMVVNSTGEETIIGTTTAGPGATCGPGYETETAAIAASFIAPFVAGVTGENPANHGGGGCEVGSGSAPGVIGVPLLAALGLAAVRRRRKG